MSVYNTTVIVTILLHYCFNIIKTFRVWCSKSTCRVRKVPAACIVRNQEAGEKTGKVRKKRRQWIHKKGCHWIEERHSEPDKCGALPGPRMSYVLSYKHYLDKPIPELRSLRIGSSNVAGVKLIFGFLKSHLSLAGPV